MFFKHILVIKKTDCVNVRKQEKTKKMYFTNVSAIVLSQKNITLMINLDDTCNITGGTSVQHYVAS